MRLSPRSTGHRRPEDRLRTNVSAETRRAAKHSDHRQTKTWSPKQHFGAVGLVVVAEVAAVDERRRTAARYAT